MSRASDSAYEYSLFFLIISFFLTKVMYPTIPYCIAILLLRPLIGTVPLEKYQQRIHVGNIIWLQHG